MTAHFKSFILNPPPYRIGLWSIFYVEDDCRDPNPSYEDAGGEPDPTYIYWWDDDDNFYQVL